MKLSSVLRGWSGPGGVGYAFWCPGCNEPHTVNGGWQFNGDVERPTFMPSIRVTKGYVESACHSHVINGQVVFLPDCKHALAGQTVPLPPLPEDDAFHWSDDSLPPPEGLA